MENWAMTITTAACLAALAPVLVAQPAPRRPRGIYAVVNITDNINQQRRANPSADLNGYFNNLFQDLLGNPAISGLTLQVHWDTLNPNPPAATNPYDWSYVDDAFNQASACLRTSAASGFLIAPNEASSRPSRVASMNSFKRIGTVCL